MIVKKQYKFLKPNNNIKLIIDLNSYGKNIGIYNYLDSGIDSENKFINFDFTINGSTVNFINYSNNNLTNILWNFGDGNISTEIDPQNTYSDITKNYIVRLSYFDNETEFFIERELSFTSTTPVKGTDPQMSSSTNIEDYFVDVNNIVSGQTSSNLSDLISYKDPNFFVGKVRNNKKIINIVDDEIIYLDNFNSDKPITYIDNGDRSLFSFIPENVDEISIQLQQIIKNSINDDCVEELKITNNLTQEVNSSELSDINLILYRTSSIEELKTSKISIKNL